MHLCANIYVYSELIHKRIPTKIQRLYNMMPILILRGQLILSWRDVVYF